MVKRSSHLLLCKVLRTQPMSFDPPVHMILRAGILGSLTQCCLECALHDVDHLPISAEV